MSKWLSIELSLLLLVSMVAFAGFVSLQKDGSLSNSYSDDSGLVSSDDAGNDLSGQLRWKAGQNAIDKLRGKSSPNSAPVQKTTPTPMPAQLSDFTSALLAGKQVQLRFDSIKGNMEPIVGVVNDLVYNSAKNQLNINFINPNTGKLETKSQISDKNEIITVFGKFIFDSKTHTFRDDGTIAVTSASGVYALDGSLKSITSQTIKEQVKCVFFDSKQKQSCYDGNGLGFGCDGVGACVADVFGKVGEKITWKSSCGGYAYTTLDGNNEYAEFKCATQTPTPFKYNGVSITCYNGETTKINVKPCKTSEELNRLREYIKADFCKGRCDSTGKKCGAGDSGLLDSCL